jgi:hypothetical protein
MEPRLGRGNSSRLQIARDRANVWNGDARFVRHPGEGRDPASHAASV